MTGILIEYLVGLYFVGISLNHAQPGGLSIEVIKFAFGVLLIALAILKVSPV